MEKQKAILKQKEKIERDAQLAVVEKKLVGS